MANNHTLHKFSNDQGVSHITVNVKTFECIGAQMPFDHPHIFLDMGKKDSIICPYCSTVFVYEAKSPDSHKSSS